MGIGGKINIDEFIKVLHHLLMKVSSLWAAVFGLLIA